jgi:hypothetical protein
MVATNPSIMARKERKVLTRREKTKEKERKRKRKRKKKKKPNHPRRAFPNQ